MICNIKTGKSEDGHIVTWTRDGRERKKVFRTEASANAFKNQLLIQRDAPSTFSSDGDEIDPVAPLKKIANTEVIQEDGFFRASMSETEFMRKTTIAHIQTINLQASLKLISAPEAARTVATLMKSVSKYYDLVEYEEITNFMRDKLREKITK